MWKLGLLMAAANIVGGYVGARVAVARGARFVRIFFLVVVVGLRRPPRRGPARRLVTRMLRPPR